MKPAAGPNYSSHDHNFRSSEARVGLDYLSRGAFTAKHNVQNCAGCCERLFKLPRNDEEA